MEDTLKKVQDEHNVDLIKIAEAMINNNNSECNQCHSNCNDCGYDR